MTTKNLKKTLKNSSLSFKLECHRNHTFEGWFDSIQDYYKAAREQDLRCPICDSSKISRNPQSANIPIDAKNTIRFKKIPFEDMMLSVSKHEIDEVWLDQYFS